MSTEIKTRDIVLTRVIDAPVERVWSAWTDCDQVMRWWGPRDYTSHACRIDLREGGKYLFHMRAPEEQGGQDHYSAGIYHRIVPMERIEYSDNLPDAEGNAIDPAQVGMPPDFPPSVRTVLTFRRTSDDKTELTVTEYDWPVGQMRDLSIAGMNESLDKLEEAVGRR